MKALKMTKKTSWLQVFSLSVLLVSFAMPLVMSNISHALPLRYVASIPAGTPCTLPDGQPGTTVDYEGIARGGVGTTCCPTDTKDPNSNHADNVSCLYEKYINPLIAVLSVLVGVVVVIAIIIGGIEVMTSTADPQRVAAGRKRIIEALIGLFAYLVLYAALQFLLPGGVFNG